ncbi:hypothetical protein QAD02_016377 [Eretmocerus hayati]|uniref:Uncharacterized protein n=1 Tax=Eretmocerus hayati TaxID=131215 RepID=A0ACC2PAE8_9HYME|nr:hypothetical protein QAD02_016377 [Eretmocerus hayati]
MCARLLSCPLCSQPNFVNLDSLRAGLVSVATRPLSCPVCDDVLIGIDKLTIHLFGHTIDGSGSSRENNSSDGQLSFDCVASGLVRSARNQIQDTDLNPYVPVQDNRRLRVSRNVADEMTQNATLEPGQIILPQNIRTQNAPSSSSLANEVEPMDQTTRDQTHVRKIEGSEITAQDDDVIILNERSDRLNNQIDTQTRDRLAALIKDAQITTPPSHQISDQTRVENSNQNSETIDDPRTTSSQILSSAKELTERCNICGCHFADQSILVLHKQLVHSIPDRTSSLESLLKNYPCHLCTKSFKMRGSLMVHMRVAHPSCNPSVSKGKAQSKVENQVKQKPEVIVSRKPRVGYECPICGNFYLNEHLYTQHVRAHDSKQWECDVCSKSFTTKHFLKKHKRLHSGETPYKCDVCDKTFTFQQSFHKHRLYHKDDKPHACSTCGRSFKELSTLHNHERIHTGEKPFACETCGKCFRQRVSYLVHRRIHTGVMPYNCSSCGKSFRYKVSQRTHKCPNQSPGATELNGGISTQKLLDIQTNADEDIIPLNNDIGKEQMITAKENQYVLVLDDEGNHVLKRQIDIENSSKEDGSSSANCTNIEPRTKNDDLIETVWNQLGDDNSDHDTNDLNPYRHLGKNTDLWNQSSINKEDSQNSEDSISKHFNIRELNDEFCNSLWSQPLSNQSPSKHQSDNVNDLFSMIMSPGESSPSSEMRHLSLSSPVNNLNNSENIDVLSPFNNNLNPVQVDCNNVGEISVEENVNLSTLRTINEDSLKDLLYSIGDG